MDIMGMQKEMHSPTNHVAYNLKWSFLAGYKIFVIY